MIRNPLKNSRNGFTLVEILITMAIASIALGAIYSVFASVQKTSTSNEVTARVMQSLRTSLDLMEADIQMAGLDQSGDADAGMKAGIRLASQTQLQFTADRNMNGAIDTADLLDGFQEQDLEQITYFLDKDVSTNMKLRQCLSLGTTVECETVAENVENFSFSYFDENNSSTADTAAIRFVEVTMTIKQPAGRAGYVSRTITKRIFCRNLAM